MAQADLLPSTIPSAVQAPTVIYLPEIHCRGGNIFPEMRTAAASKTAIVQGIADGQHDDVIRVIGIDLASGSCWDASKEIAQAVLDVILQDYSRVPAWCVEFIEEQLGVHYVRACERSAA